MNNATDGDIQRLVFNSEGTKLMQVNLLGLMSEYDFDRCTGMITNPNLIFPENSTGDGRFSFGAYSPDGTKFYISTEVFPNDISYLFQYDLTAANIPASCDTLAMQGNPIASGALKLAPDNKIYFSSYYYWGFPGYPYPDSVRNMYNENLSVINNPNNLDAACGYAPFSFYLGGKRTYYGLPNNPNYSLGRLVGSPCDTLRVITELEGNEKSPLIHLAPNPVQRNLYFNAERVKEKNARVFIRNALGEMVYEKEVEVFSGSYVTQQINVSEFSKGVYFITLQTDKEIASGRFVKE